MLDLLNGASRAAAPQNNPMAMMGQLRQMVSMLRGRDPQQVAQLMAQRNPQFAAFLQQNRGKSPEQIASENGIDMNMVRELILKTWLSMP